MALTPQSYLPATVASLWQNLPQVLLGAIVFSVLSAPAFVLFVLGLFPLALVAGILAMAPGWAALLRFEARLAEGRAAGWDDLLGAFPYYWTRSIRLAMVAVFLLAAAVFAAPWLATLPLALELGTLTILLGILVFFVVLLYGYPQLALYDVDPYTALRNSAVLATRHIANTLGLIAMGFLMLLAVVYVSLGFLFILPAVYAMFIVNNCRLVVSLEEKQ